MNANPAITRDLLDHVSGQLAPDAMHPYAPADPAPPKWPTEEHWARLAALDAQRRADLLKSTFGDAATAVYIQQMINTTQSSGLYNTAFYFVQDHLFELVHARSDPPEEASGKGGKKNKLKKLKQEKEREREKLLVIYKTKRFEWPQDDPATMWLLNRVIFPARNGVDVCELTCASEIYQNLQLLRDAVNTLARTECKTFDVMRTAPEEVRRLQTGRTAGAHAPMVKMATVMAVSLAGFLALRLAACVHDLPADPAQASDPEIGKCLAVYSDVASRASSFSSAFIDRYWRSLSLMDRINLLQRVFPETTHPARRAKAVFVEALTNNPAIELAIPDADRPASGFPQLLSSIAAVESLGGFLCEFVCYVRLTEYHADGWCKWAEESTSVLQDQLSQCNATELLADGTLEAAVDTGLTQPSRPKKKKKKKPKRKASQQPQNQQTQAKQASPPVSDSDSDTDSEENDDDDLLRAHQSVKIETLPIAHTVMMAPLQSEAEREPVPEPEPERQQPVVELELEPKPEPEPEPDAHREQWSAAKPQPAQQHFEPEPQNQQPEPEPQLMEDIDAVLVDRLPPAIEDIVESVVGDELESAPIPPVPATVAATVASADAVSADDNGVDNLQFFESRLSDTPGQAPVPQLQRSDTDDVLEAALSIGADFKFTVDEYDAKIEPITFDDEDSESGSGMESAETEAVTEGSARDDSFADGAYDSPRSTEPQPPASRTESPALTRENSASVEPFSLSGNLQATDVPSTEAVVDPQTSPRRSDVQTEELGAEFVDDDDIIPDEERDTFDTQERASGSFAAPQPRRSNPAAFQQILLRRMGSESSIASSEHESRSPPPSMRLSARGAQLLRASIPGAAAAAAMRRAQTHLISESLLRAQLMNNTEHMADNDGSIDLIALQKFQELCDRLTDDIEDMARALNRIAVVRRPWQLAAIERVRAIITSLWPHSTVEVYGSFTTGLAIPASDVDLVVCGMHEMLQWWGGKAVSAVSILADALRGAEWVSTVQAVEQTAVPVVKVSIAPVPTSFGDRRGIIRMDISFDVNTFHGQPQHQGQAHPHPPVHQGLQARDFTLRLCAMNPQLTPLVLVLKQYLLENGLHDAYMGGLPSHALTVMVASMLQRHALEPPEQQPDLGTLLLGFFQQFGTSFDTRKHMVCLSPMGPLVTLTPLHSPHVPRVGTPEWWRPADPVVIQDPLQPNNNIGRACFGFRQLQLHFDRALQSLLKFGDECKNISDPEISALGALFSTAHHRSVVQLAAQVWCPREQAVSVPQPVFQKQVSTTGDEERLQRCIDMLKVLPRDELKRFELLLREATTTTTTTTSGRASESEHKQQDEKPGSAEGNAATKSR